MRSPREDQTQILTNGGVGNADSGQMTVDFVISVVIFISVFLFATQFVVSTASPVVSTEDGSIERFTIGDRLYYDRLSTENASQGVLEFSYFFDGSNLKNESEISTDLGLDADSIQIKVTESDTGETVELNGKNISIGDDPPEIGAEINEVERVGYTERNGTVLVKLRVW